MDHKALYDHSTLVCSKQITRMYSTSFSLGIRAFSKKFHLPIYGIYGFVRYADEIVDTFHEHDKKKLLEEFKAETFLAIERKLSLNPVLHAFQLVVNEYGIEKELIDAFLKSMEMDLYDIQYNTNLYNEYIYGSAEVVGLMCLRVFCKDNQQQYQSLVAPARALGAAFQKINFLRDIKSDYQERGRTYFPEIDFKNFTNEDKIKIEKDIKADFDHGFEGIKLLPKGAKLGVYIAYVYYLQLFKKIQSASAAQILHERIRVADNQKLALLCSSYFKFQFNAI
jgi:phytoene/squalene synthetase